MSGSLPAPEFDSQNYARPNQDWSCGHACEGRACPLGPDARGRCQATAECRPVLKINPGETKGRWHCTRQGGECAEGPLPDGRCCRPIDPCAPVATLRWWRGRITLAVVTIACAGLLILLGVPPWRNGFINPGPLSSPHSGAAFAVMAASNHLDRACGACHMAGTSGPAGQVRVATQARPGFFDLAQMATARAESPTAIDAACLSCHAGRQVHQTAAPPFSCSFCHQEHHGAALAAVTDQQCAFCHADAAKMAVAPRVPVIHHFATDHPEFPFLAGQQKDPDTLKFNHALHLTGTTIPQLPGGGKLDCQFCHQPEAAGALMKPVSFEANCRVCHSLQFDPQTPQLQLLHGSVGAVVAYLHSLPNQYQELGRQVGAADPAAFAANKLAGLREQFGRGEDLEQEILLSTATTGPAVQIGTVSGAGRPRFPGCAYCHEVKLGGRRPEITPPVQVARWLAPVKFDHARHAGVTCGACHDAVHSRETADILLPGRALCATCHSPQGGVADGCAECHTYHQHPFFKAGGAPLKAGI
ncbi:MAG TPA: hypothetical protein VF607_15040 [Verrucomicrobiae bacterium]